MKRRGSWRMIKRDNEDYLERYMIFRCGFLNIYLHCLWQNDEDDPHCHPWWNFSWIFRGSYIEHFLDGTFAIRKKGDFVFREARSFHRLEIPEGVAPGETWSLFITLKKVRGWGFLTSKGWVKASDYCEEEVEIYGRDFILKGIFFPVVVKLKRGTA